MPLQLLNRDTGQKPYGTPYGHIPESDSVDVLWDWLEDTLREAYGVEGMFYITYPVGDAAGTLAEMLERAVWKTSYEPAFLKAIGGNILENDRSGLIVLETGRMCRWDEPAIFDNPTKGEKRRLELNAEHDMDVGACLPLHTSGGRISGGVGLRSRHLPADEFYTAITEDETALTQLLAAFDARFRGPLASETFHITAQEKKVLAHIAGGMGVLRAAHELHLSPKTVEFYMRSVRMKTRSATTAEAVAKAVFFNML